MGDEHGKRNTLQNGMVALVDDEDYERCMNHIWMVNVVGKGTRLCVRTEMRGTGEVIQLNRFITQCNEGDLITYKDNDPLNCTKENLIAVTKKELSQKRRGDRNATSKYKGVHWRKDSKRWRAIIVVNKKKINLGSFINEDEAAVAYNKAALEYFGEHAYQNRIGEDNSAETFEIENQKQARNNNEFRGTNVSKSGNWYGQIRWKGEMIYLGTFKTREEAARAYDAKAYELHGDKAILNFPEEYKTSI